MSKQVLVIALLISSFTLRPLAMDASTIHVSMQKAHWNGLEPDAMGPQGKLQFNQQEGFPDGLMTLNGGSASLQDVNFAEGTIEYDFKPIGEEAPGIQFRASGDHASQNAEEIYFRVSKDCRASDDCIQYTPVIHGFMLWDIYPQYQHQALLLDAWNHVRIVVSRHRAQVFVNYGAEPALTVDELASGSPSGAIHFRGPAVYANLSITSGSPAKLSAAARPDTTEGDHGIVRRWRVSHLVPITTLAAPSLHTMPVDSNQWDTWETERGGLLNLNRHYVAGTQPAAINWLAFDVYSNRKKTKRVSMGWVGEAWVFANGKPVRDDKNFYYPDTERKFPDGRLSLSNSSFDLALEPGINHIAIALYPQVRDSIRTRTKYGWGFAMRFADMQGLHFK